MIITLLPDERLAAALAAALPVKRQHEYPFYFATGETFAVAAVGDRPTSACGIAGYVAGLIEAQTVVPGRAVAAPLAEARKETALVNVATAPLGNGTVVAAEVADPDEESRPILALKVFADANVFYPDPLLLSGLAPGEVRSTYLYELLRWSNLLFPPDLIYPILLPGESPPAEETLSGVVSYLHRLLNALPEKSAPLSSEQKALLSRISEGLRLSFGARETLHRAATERAVREGSLPDEIAGYAALTASSRAQGERLLREILVLLREPNDE